MNNKCAELIVQMHRLVCGFVIRVQQSQSFSRHSPYIERLFSGFKPDKVPANLDAIIIGSGIGGLTTAVLLGRTGQKVLVLERHDQAGGTCHTFIDKGFEFDTGMYSCICDQCFILFYAILRLCYCIQHTFDVGYCSQHAHDVGYCT